MRGSGGRGMDYTGKGGVWHSLEELEPFDYAAVAGEEHLEILLRYGGPTGRKQP